MKSAPRNLPLIASVLSLALANATASAAIENITSVSAGTDGTVPYTLASITVGSYTVAANELAVGDTDALTGGNDDNSDFFGTWPAPYTDPAPSSNFDINDILARNTNNNPVVITMFGGAVWEDSNGSEPDFFIFESASGGGDTVSVEAIFEDDSHGMPVDLPATGEWGDTGLTRVGSSNGGQAIVGISFGVDDLLDASGTALDTSAKIKGLQFNSTGVDPSFIGAVVPASQSDTHWGYTIVDGYISTAEWVGWIYVEKAPWYYSTAVGSWFYCHVPGDQTPASGAWFYAANQ